ncbi:MAG: hypothetical protein IPI67_05335 [Myxococcales bacterium]|nr:hypothetical protein [Myxococcales bacterium]
MPRRSGSGRGGLLPQASRVVLALAALLFIERCAPSAPPPATGRVEPDVQLPVTDVEQVDSGPAAAVDAGQDVGSVDVAVAVTPLGTSSERFRCGLASCQAAKETCCLAGNEGVCFASSPDDAPKGKVGYLKTQFDACNAASLPHGYSLSGIERCDESIDCAKGEICCDQFLFSGATISECVASKPAAPTPCEYGERCIESATCRLAGTSCVEGYCRKLVAKLRCDQAPCADGEVCCGSPLGCRASAACEGYHRVRCNTDGDCVKGQRCFVSGYGSDCIALLQDPLSQQLVCRRDADCKFPCPGAGGKLARCLPAEVTWLRSCQCPFS